MSGKSRLSTITRAACAACFREQAASHRIWCSHRGVLQAWINGALVIIVSSSRETAERTLDLVRAWMREAPDVAA
jgi:hypothetical protein